jgi:hypothetical protein
MQIEVSNGEIVDKLSIIQIKLQFINDDLKRKNLLAEHQVLINAVNSFFTTEHPLFKALLDINTQLWHIEDKCRALENVQQFDDEFIQTARSVYICNDKRAEIKKQINLLTNSTLIEEKSYQ